jgi:hypothetical protein
VNASISLYRDRIIIDSKEWGVSKSYQLPIGRISAVVIERKSIIPFATLAIFTAAVAVITRYNVLSFLVDLAPETAGMLSSVALFVAVICAIPVLIRILFVSVSIAWDGDPTSFRVGFVLLRPGKRLTSKFQESSTWG